MSGSFPIHMTLAFVKGCSAGTSTKTGSGPLKPCSLRYSAMKTEYVDVMKPTKRCRGGPNAHS